MIITVKKERKLKQNMNLNRIFVETIGAIPVQSITYLTTNWTDDVECYDGYTTGKPVNVVLPTVPDASRDYYDMTDKVPMNPPYFTFCQIYLITLTKMGLQSFLGI